MWGTVLVSCLQSLAHMSLAEIYIMEATVMSICVLIDIPSGSLADIIGRKKTIIIGRTFLLASYICFAFMQNPVMAWVGNILWAFGYSMQSGADSALLYESLKEVNREHQYKKIEGEVIGFRLLLVAACALLAGYLASIDLRLPLIIGIPFMTISLIIAFLFTEPIRVKKYSINTQIEVLQHGITFFKNRREVMWIVGFAALLSTTSKIWFFTYNPYFEKVNLPVQYFGVLFFLLNIVAWVSSKYAYKLEEKMGEKNCVLLMIVCLSTPIILMSLFPTQLSTMFVLVQNIVRGFMMPFVSGYMNHHLDSKSRATVLSIRSTASNLTAIVGLFLFGLSLEYFSLLGSLFMLGMIFLVLGGISFRSYLKL
jgi:MFS family permease